MRCSQCSCDQVVAAVAFVSETPFCSPLGPRPRQLLIGLLSRGEPGHELQGAKIWPVRVAFAFSANEPLGLWGTTDPKI